MASLACVNHECPSYGRAGQGNLKEGRVRWTRKTYGPDQIRHLRCLSCQSEFSERKNTPLWNSKIGEGKTIPSFRSDLECSGVARTDSLDSLTYLSVWGAEMISRHYRIGRDATYLCLFIHQRARVKPWQHIGALHSKSSSTTGSHLGGCFYVKRRPAHRARPRSHVAVPEQWSHNSCRVSRPWHSTARLRASTKCGRWRRAQGIPSWRGTSPSNGDDSDHEPTPKCLFNLHPLDSRKGWRNRFPNEPGVRMLTPVHRKLVGGGKCLKECSLP